MKIAVNATSLRSAGGRSVAINFLSVVRDARSNLDLTAYVPPNAGYRQIGDSVDMRPIPESLDYSVAAPLVDYFWLPKRIRRDSPDVVFSMGNMAIPVEVPQLLTFMFPYAVYPDSDVWDRMGILEKSRAKVTVSYFKKNLQHADLVAAQTEVAKKRLKRMYEVVNNVEVVPTSVSTDDLRNINEKETQFSKDRLSTKKVTLMCLSRYYIHKNLEVFLKLAKKIKTNDMEIEIITTVEPDHHPRSEKFLSKIENLGLKSQIVNVGEIPMSDVSELYDQSDGMILPTLMESYSQTYVEAMHFGVPILTSDLDFAHTVCQDAAYYFDPNDPDSILSTIKDAFSNKKERNRKVKKGKLIAQNNPTWREVAEKYIKLLDTLV